MAILTQSLLFHLSNELKVPEEEHATTVVERELDLAYTVINVGKIALVVCASLVLTFHFHLVLDRLAIHLDCDSAVSHLPRGEVARFQHETCIRVFGADP